MNKIDELNSILVDLIEAKATALKDADFGIHGFVHKGDIVKVVRSGPDHYLLDLGKSRFSHPRALAHAKIDSKQFANYFSIEEKPKDIESEEIV